MGHFLRQKLQHLELLAQGELRARRFASVVRLGMKLPRPPGTLLGLLGSRFALALYDSS